MDVQELADEVGVGKGTVYRYFPTKRDLFLAAVDRGMRQLTERIDAVLVGEADPVEQMCAATQAYLRFFHDNADMVELLIQERAECRDREKPTYFLYQEQNRQRWAGIVQGLIAAGRVRDMPVEGVFEVIGDLLYGTMFTNYFARRNLPPEQQAASIIDIAFRGILTDEERAYRYGRPSEGRSR